MTEAKNQALNCLQNIQNLLDRTITKEAQQMIVENIEATINGVRKMQHKATKEHIWDTHQEYNGLDYETLDAIAMPDIN